MHITVPLESGERFLAEVGSSWNDRASRPFAARSGDTSPQVTSTWNHGAVIRDVAGKSQILAS